MPESFFHYIERLELQFFLSGHVVVSALVFLLARNKSYNNFFRTKVISCLAYSYALAATLYLGWLLKTLYPDYSFEHLRDSAHNPILKLFGLSALLLWIPRLSKPFISLLHSLVFFAFLIWDIYDTAGDPDKLKNGLKIFTGSILLHILCLVVIVAFMRIRKIVSRLPDNTHGI